MKANRRRERSALTSLHHNENISSVVLLFVLKSAKFYIEPRGLKTNPSSLNSGK